MKLGPNSSLFSQFIVRFLTFSGLGLFLLTLNAFGINDAADQASQNALYKVLAPFYKSKARDDIVVVLVNDAAIEDLYQRGVIAANEWPLLYSDHAYLLNIIAQYGARSVFVDIYFKKERSTDDSFPRLLSRLQKAETKFGVKYLFAGGYQDEEYNPIQNKLAESFELVLNGWEGYGKAYPLLDGGKTSAALRLYQQACADDAPLLGCANERVDARELTDGNAVSVRWGSAPANVPFPEFTSQQCTSAGSNWYEMGRQLILGLINGLFFSEENDRTVQIKCAYHRTLYADDMVLIAKSGTPEQRQRLVQLLRDKVVLYGVDLEGLHDVVESPVHGRLPAVMVHAMALDNLMHFGSEYTKSGDDRLDLINMVSWPIIVLIFTAFFYFYESRSQSATLIDQAIRKGGREQPNALRHSRSYLISLGVGLTVVVSLSIFYIFNYEPVNSLSYFAVVGLMGLLIDNQKRSVSEVIYYYRAKTKRIVTLRYRRLCNLLWRRK